MEGLYLFFVSVAAMLINGCLTAEYYVTSDEENSCPCDIPCYSLSYYFNNPDTYFVDNAVFIFQKGTHALDQDEVLFVDGVTNITMRGEESELVEGFHHTVLQPPVLIDCQHSPTGIVIHNSDTINISGLTFTNCGGYLPFYIADSLSSFNPLGHIARENWSDYTMALSFIGTTNVNLYKISIQNSTDFGLFSFNTLGFSISYSSFAGNNLEGHHNCTLNSCHGGNAGIMYTTLSSCNNRFNIYSTSITHSNFTFGYDSSFYSTASASGLAFYMEQSDYYGVEFQLDSLVLYGNTGIHSVNFRFAVSRNAYYSLTMTNSISVYGNQIYPLPKAVPILFLYGSGFSAFIGINNNARMRCFNRAQLPVRLIASINLINCSFSHNNASFGAGIMISFHHRRLPINQQQHVIIESCILQNNSGFSGAGFFYTQLNRLNYNIIVKNVTVSDTRHYHPKEIGAESSSSTILIRRADNVTLIDLTVQHNKISGMLLLNSLVSFKGNNSFVNNSAENGGGLVLYGDSLVILMPPVNISFIKNSATNKGGAICVSTIPYTKPPCFMMPYDPTLNKEPKINITFSGNVANIAGSAIYGGLIDRCYLTYSSGFSVNGSGNSLGRSAFEYITHFHDQNGSSRISSDPEQVCFCSGGMPNCSIEALNFTLLPGQSANFSIITLGHMNGVSPGIVAIQERGEMREEFIHMRYESTETACSYLHYQPEVNEDTTYPTVHYANLFLPQDNPLTRKVYFNITKCPLGFDVSSITHACDCNNELSSSGSEIFCDASTSSFSHQGSKWVGYMNESNCFVSSTKCHWNYCKEDFVNFTLETNDAQCDLNRTGLLCGQCAEGHSLLLGSNKCAKCTNDFLSLIIIFAFAGIVLIAFITILNLTVSIGTINGLIFYANIVKINELNFFSGRRASKYFSWFTSWINLDFGIETCFFDGMASYTKIWLQFAFPFYLWFLMICIIFLSRRSYRISKLLGRHSISVLATVLLLSFTKIMRTCILIWQLSSIQCGSHKYYVWSVDPSIDYFSSKHLLIFLFALIVFLFLALPYTLLLLFSPLIEGYFSRYKCCKWWVKLKPLFDAYNGPYQDKHRYWTGLLLLVRLFMVLVFSFNTAGENATVVIIVIVCGVMLCTIGLCNGLYRHKINTVLECFYVLNLIFIASVSLVNFLETFSVMLSLLVFLGIVTSHLLVQLKVPKKIKRLYRKLMKKEEAKRERLPIQVDLLDDRRVISHDVDTEMTTTLDLQDRLKALYREGSVFVQMKRETLIRDDAL